MFKRLFNNLRKLSHEANKKTNTTGSAGKVPHELDAYFREVELRRGDAMRPDEMPAWDLFLRSPFDEWSSVRSWIGGKPCVQSDFVWPRSREEGASPLLFLAQINLADLFRNPVSTEEIGIPRSGALLVFVDDRDCSCKLLSDAELVNSRPMDPPKGTPPLQESGYYRASGATFNYWPVDPEPFLSRKSDIIRLHQQRHGNLSPENWIRNWGIAAVEAREALAVIRREFQFAKDWKERQRGQQQELADKPAHIQKVLEKKGLAASLSIEKLPGLIERIELWRKLALENPSTDEIPPDLLSNHFSERLVVSEAYYQHVLSHVLPGAYNEVWRWLKQEVDDISVQENWKRLPKAFHPLAEHEICKKRGHQILGLPQVTEHSDHDFRGLISLIEIQCDELTAMSAEHRVSNSVWCDRAELAKGGIARAISVPRPTG